MATDLTHLGIDDEESIEEIANAVQDDLAASLKKYPGQASSPDSIGRAAYDVVRAAFGLGEDEDEDEDDVVGIGGCDHCRTTDDSKFNTDGTGTYCDDCHATVTPEGSD